MASKSLKRRRCLFKLLWRISPCTYRSAIGNTAPFFQRNQLDQGLPAKWVQRSSAREYAGPYFLGEKSGTRIREYSNLYTQRINVQSTIAALRQQKQRQEAQRAWEDA